MLKERVKNMRNGSEMRLDTSALQYPDLCKVSRRLLDRDLLASFDQVCSHVIDHVYVGSGTVARSREILMENGITHILNSAGFACPEYFPDEFTYKTLWLKDSPSEDITSVLYIVFDFIEAVRQQGGRVFVHCCKGVSRSTSLVIAYLTWLQRCTFQDAFNFIKAARAVTNPNLGFACQLLQFQKQLQNAPALNNKLRVYRMAPHSSHDPLLLVPKKVTGPDILTFDSRGVFVIHGQNNLYVWHGQVCDARMAKAGHEFALQLIRYEQVEGPPVNINEDDEPADFWELLRTGVFSRTSSDVSSFGSDLPQRSAEESSSSASPHVVDGDVLFRRLQGLCPGEDNASCTTNARGCEDSDGDSSVDGSSTGQHDQSVSGARTLGQVCRPLKTLSIYDKDFELFESAKDLPVKNEPSPVSKDIYGWRRLRGKFFSGPDSIESVPSGNEGIVAAIPSP
ncbi:protein-tyrosine-phosphatase MKP1 [Physcomitrium patens]|uniref:Uncharacterized protein n=1 Tax=Physcomitrium patens TaxID=3218 RepID=A0A2K1KAP9_PHYPA|nr:protein-tyrosine-phosphatase MKP1-like [Physcomitrium patens]XP_024379943.1 protein-tyrosine-phosphatase MKP1-like [Physcomitrium patens]XP_024379944.1 protein-tyrosine-phosphatase MKP1-like [Physcomitrium patens]PNR50852.1 hypothetical protein PHYPA_010038 [Physcomitrium patens]|eukprot:XP_024379942.1 protein-tyrosine-phosphatase MKP1-like [Physcomitrella patens]